MREIISAIEFLKGLLERFQADDLEDSDIPFLADEVKEHIKDLEKVLDDAQKR